MNVAMIVAAGSGRRFGGDVPKQFVEVLGRPVIAYVLDVLERSTLIDGIEVVCKPEHMALVSDIARRFGIAKLRWIAAGGATCQDSIRGGIYALREVMRDDDILMMHMAVAPMLTQAAVARSIGLCREKGCSFAAYPINICMGRRTAQAWTDEAVYKEDYIELNAPWTFRYGAVYDLYREADRRGLGRDARDYTVNLWLQTGHRAYTYPGCEEGRLKITTPHDLKLFEALLLAKRREAAGDALCDGD